MKTLRVLTLCTFTAFYASGQSDCTPIPEVNFPGGRVVMSYDGNVHDDDDIGALAYAGGLWWAAGLKDKVVQVEYNNHICDTNVFESDGIGPGTGDDSQNMRMTAKGTIENFGYSPSIFYDYERQGKASTAKMAAEIEKSTASNPLWIIAAGPMETVWRALDAANRGLDHVFVISHSKWNEKHAHCDDAHDWDDLKNDFQSKGVYFVENCDDGDCSGSNKLNDQNGGFNSWKGHWKWMANSDKAYNRWIYSRNPWSSKFDPSDAGMSYFLITGGPFNGGNKTPDHNDARKLMENPCQAKGPAPETNQAPNLSVASPSKDASYNAGDNVTVKAIANDPDGSITKVSLYINDDFIGSVAKAPFQWNNETQLKNLKKGEYRLKLVAKDDDGATSTKTFAFSVTDKKTDKTPEPKNQLPVIAIVSPQDNQTVVVGDKLPIDVSATDDGNVVKYQIFVNGDLLDTDGENFTPYIIDNIKEGSHAIRVEVTDDKGGKTVKEIAVKAKKDRTDKDEKVEEEEKDEEKESSNTGNAVFNFVSPTDGAGFDAGETITVDLAGTKGSNIVRYQIFVNDRLVDTDPANFTPYRITDAKKGTYTIRAEATAGNGVKTVETVIVEVGKASGTDRPSGKDAPISLSFSPGKGAIFEEGSNVSVKVSASSQGGSIVKYQIFVNGRLVDTDPAHFTAYKILDVKRGTYTVEVKVTDNRNRSKAEKIQFSVRDRAIGKVARLYGVSEMPSDGSVSLRIAPNPVQGSLMNVFQKRSGVLWITNVYGTLVQRIDHAGEVAKIDVSGLAPGMYILKSETENAKFVIPE